MKQPLLILLLFYLMSHYRFLQSKMAPLPGPTNAPSWFVVGQSQNAERAGSATRASEANGTRLRPGSNDYLSDICSG
ncbi:hypothetical protein [Spirosoma validum]|uniref:Uncharacterized protein n=1 Tax=Spirosoma validum TaxID=2771355 RepID=A0A927GDQ8_9BACT|nr:hypothetical protein [Spirosoma validum]MBD2753984.1 hypothetical protein [Spirosoma validum]